MDARGELIGVLAQARIALAHADNDFSWSSWADDSAALCELDEQISALKAGGSIESLDLEILFAATGPICEVALSSGWSEAYLRLSEAFDAALERIRASDS
jgi:hypothetical protein